MNNYDVLVIGGGHAGIEAAVAAAHSGVKVCLLTMSKFTLGEPSCNPSIGGTAKGHIVKEIDALGGAMGLLADRSGIHFKMLNTSKGPAVQSPRCQIDKFLYPQNALSFISAIENIEILEGTAVEILIRNYFAVGVKLIDGSEVFSKSVIFTPGTFLNGKMLTGTNYSYGGRFGEKPAEKISDYLAACGFEKGRLKTGTPPRIKMESIDFSKTKPEPGDVSPQKFSYKSQSVENKIMCYLTSTNLDTHDILRTGFDRSPLFTGVIKGTGPRYCPSIEDKIVRFANHDSHKIVLEPEGLSTDSVYVNGYSTSLPEDVQLKGLHSIPGLENCELIRPGYAIEYDYFPSWQLNLTLETKDIHNLYFAGQINGSSGYEEAAGQGLIAGANAALKILDKDPIILLRNEAYIGVMIDDLVNKTSSEPYRMFTSLAEYRLLLRHDTAKYRLSDKAFASGLIDEKSFVDIQAEKESIDNFEKNTHNIFFKPEEINPYLTDCHESNISEKISLFNLIKRNNTDIHSLMQLHDNSVNYDDNLLFEASTDIKYEGYISRQLKEVDYFKENENKRIPKSFDYTKVQSLSEEAREKLLRIKPDSLGQLSRIPGVSATDVSIVSVYLKK